MSAVDKKLNYLIKTFSRTKRKDYENFIINAIWNKMDRDDIQPVSQQYVNLGNGKYSLLDLYFPQLNLAIECDESYHQENKAHDRQREISIESALSALNNFNVEKDLIRIRADLSYNDVIKQINNAVNIINHRINTMQFSTWEVDKNPTEIARKNGKIHVDDNLTFSTIYEIANCFGKDYTGYQKSSVHLDGTNYLWCLKMAIVIDGVPTAGSSRGWVNTLTEDQEIMCEVNDTRDSISFERGTPSNRILFGKSRNALGEAGYKFIGIFIFDYHEDGKNYYKRISKEVDLSLWI
ncbi:MAG: hypothetical protein R3Y32_03465 [Bacillota bacterium]